MGGFGRVCVFLGSQVGRSPRYAEATEALAAELVRRGTGLVYGGGAVGLMGVLADAVMAAGGTVDGVIPRGLFEREVEHPALTTLHKVGSMHERKATMYQLGDAFVALPGGLGTLEELAETLTWVQIGLHAKPVGILDVGGFYAPLRGFLEHTVAEGFTKAASLEAVVVEEDPGQLLDRMAEVAARVGGVTETAGRPL
ncbi:MAG: TIGR00730 family Rossman fold protein [Acidimicrobiia bacterium]|nr:TIGR00730 family Rossman fold protein [Acidimicrobiia bacterium]